MSLTEMSAKSENHYQSKPLPQFVLRPKQMSSSVTALCFWGKEDKEFLICGTDCGQLLFWSLLTYRCETIINDNNNSNSRINHLISLNGQFICQYKNGVIDVFDDQLLVKKSYQMSNMSYCKCFLYSETVNTNSCETKPKLLGMVSKNDNNIIDLIDFNSDKCLLKVEISDKSYGMAMTLFITSLDAFQNSIVLILIGYENGFLTLFKSNTETKESQLMSRLKCFDSMITCMDFSPPNNYGICCSVTDIISVWNLHKSDDKSTICLSLKSNLKITNSGVLCCGIRPDARVFACGGSDSRIRVFAMKSLKPLAVIDTHSQTIECVLYSNRLKCQKMQYLLAASSRDKTISVWSIYN